MSIALYERVARAVWETPGEVIDVLPWAELDERERESERLLAGVAIREVLAALAEQIEALREGGRLIYMDDATLRGYAACLDEVLAVVARLGEAVSDGG